MAAYYNEIDPKAAAWLRELIKVKLIADGEVDTRSIIDVSPGDVRGFVQCHFFAGIGGWSYALRLAGWDDDRECWSGSCPCQPWSVAGSAAGPADSRDLWPAWFRLWSECQPGVVFGEQVESPASRAWIDRVCDDVEGIGYAIGPVDLPAACVGAPQGRQRIWFVADSDHERWERGKREGQPDQAGAWRETPRCESMRSARGSWPAGPGAIDAIPVQPHGIPDPMGGCKGYGNAIVPEVAAEVIAAYLSLA